MVAFRTATIATDVRQGNKPAAIWPQVGFTATLRELDFLRGAVEEVTSPIVSTPSIIPVILSW